MNIMINIMIIPSVEPDGADEMVNEDADNVSLT